MKIQNISQSVLLTTTLLLSTAPAFAQKLDVVKAIGEGIAKTNIEQSLVADAQRTIGVMMTRSTELYATQAARLAASPVGPIENKQIWPDYRELTEMLNSYAILVSAGETGKYSPKESNFLKLTQSSPEQHFFSRMTQEQAVFNKEIKAASFLWTDLQRAKLSHKLFTPEGKKEFAARIEKIPNPTLRRDLSKALEEENFTVLERDLREYYSLGMDDAEAALQYATHHAHGRNLALRRALASPFVSQSHKAAIKRFLSYNSLEETNVSDFVTLLTTVFRAQKSLRNYFSNSKPVEEKIEALKNFTDRFTAFVEKNKRLPKSDPAVPEENTLSMEYTSFLWERPFCTAEPFAKYYRQHDALLKQYNLARKK